jgi:hypothetical protein
MNRPLTFCVLMSSLLTLSACQQSRELTEMHDTTAEMRDITKDMRDNTSEMNKSTKSLNTETSSMQDSMASVLKEMQDTNKQMKGMSNDMQQMSQTTNALCQSRHAQAALVRNGAFKQLLDAETPEAKVAGATEYLMGFEFQQWGICGDDTLATRDQLISTAMQEFFFNISEALSSNTNASALASAHTFAHLDDPQDMTFNAIAAALHGIDDVQIQTLRKCNATHTEKVRFESLLSLFIEGMKLSNAPQASLNSWQHQVLANRRIVIRLLQARQTFTVAVVVGKLSSQATSGVGTSMSLLIDKTLRLGTAWKANIDNFTIDELDQFSFYLSISLETRKALKDLGIQAVVDPELAPFINGVYLTTSSRGPNELMAARQKFNRLLTLVKATH